MNNFTDPERAAVYKAIMLRRDIRRQFESNPISHDVLVRILSAAHHAGSVGFMQPWDFVIIEDRATRQKVLDSFLRERDRAANFYDDARRDLFLSLKLEGILESALNLCVTCDRTRGGPHVLGRSTILETDLYSTCCAVQNLWLAGRAEGIGVGWVSIVDPGELSRILGLPDHVVPVKVVVTPSRLRTIRVGAGFELDALKTDVHGVVGWQSRNFFGGLRSFSSTFFPWSSL